MKIGLIDVDNYEKLDSCFNIHNNEQVRNKVKEIAERLKEQKK